MANILRTYGDVSIKEDVVLNSVEILTAKEVSIMNMLGKTQAIATVHSYLTDSLSTPASSAVTEGGDYVNSARTTPVRLTNVVQKSAIPFSVTETQQFVQHYTGENELERQTKKALMEWGNSVEFDLVRSTLVSGVSGTATKASGIIEAISKATNTTSHASGTIWSASILDGLMKDNWDNSNGDVATDLFMGSFLRNATDGFVQKTNMVVNSPGPATIYRTVSTYTTALGTLNLHTHRYVNDGDATGRVLAINPAKLRMAYLKMPFIDTDLAKSGPYTRRAVTGDWTLEVRNQDSNFFSDGFNIG